MDMNTVREQFTVFMADMYARSQKLGIELGEYPVDHVDFRVKDMEAHRAYFDLFKHNSVLYTKNFLRGRSFTCFVLKQPFRFQERLVAFLEFAEPGGSDAYETGFQHLEILTPLSIVELFPQARIAALLYTGSSGGGVYLKWPDKKALKLTSRPLIEKSLLEDRPEIFGC